MLDSQPSSAKENIEVRWDGLGRGGMWVGALGASVPPPPAPLPALHLPPAPPPLSLTCPKIDSEAHKQEAKCQSERRRRRREEEKKKRRSTSVNPACCASYKPCQILSGQIETVTLICNKKKRKKKNLTSFGQPTSTTQRVACGLTWVLSSALIQSGPCAP